MLVNVECPFCGQVTRVDPARVGDFIDCPELFDRESFYGTPSGDYPDNAERFGLFSRAVIEASKVIGIPDVFHVHDWQASMLSVYLRTVYYFDPALRNAGTVLTIHNGGYQGWFPPQTTERLLLPWEIFTMDKVERYDTFNYLKGGIVYSDAITTVSKKYAEEIKTPAYGNGLESVLQKAPRHTPALERLLDITLGAGDELRTAQLAAQLEQIHLSRGDQKNAERFAELRQRYQGAAAQSAATQAGFDAVIEQFMRSDAVPAASVSVGFDPPRS